MNAPDVAVANAADVEAILDDMADEIAPHLTRESALLGILRRGAPLAQMLAKRLSARCGWSPRVLELKLKRYGERLELLHDRPHLDESSLLAAVRDHHLIVVDDVLYTGESLLRAVDFLRQAGATRIQIAVLAERCGRTMPIAAEFIGMKLDIRPDWVIHCEVPPYEDHLAIRIAHHRAITGD